MDALDGRLAAEQAERRASDLRLESADQALSARFDSCHLAGAIRTYNEQSDSDKPNSWRIAMLNCNKDAQVTYTDANTLQPTIINPIG